MGEHGSAGLVDLPNGGLLETEEDGVDLQQ